MGTPFEETWPKDTALGEAFRLPQVRGIIESLLGPDPLYDHHFAHLVAACSVKGPNLHQDSVIDFRENYFDIQLSLFPVDTPDEMGGTFLVPGTHFRNVRTGEIGGYHHITGVEASDLRCRRFHANREPARLADTTAPAAHQRAVVLIDAVYRQIVPCREERRARQDGEVARGCVGSQRRLTARIDEYVVDGGRHRGRTPVAGPNQVSVWLTPNSQPGETVSLLPESTLLVATMSNEVAATAASITST